MTSKCAFQPKAFYDSMKSFKVLTHHDAKDINIYYVFLRLLSSLNET